MKLGHGLSLPDTRRDCSAAILWIKQCNLILWKTLLLRGKGFFWTVKTPKLNGEDDQEDLKLLSMPWCDLNSVTLEASGIFE